MPKPTKKPAFSSQKNPKYKGSADFLWIYGKHAALPTIQNTKRHILEIVISRNNTDLLEKALNNHPKREKLQSITTLASGDVFAKILPSDAVHQGIAVKTTPLPSPHLEDILLMNKENNAPLLILDQVSDPHNVGAILRSCAAFNVAALIVTKDNAPKETGIIAKSACGALETTPIVTVTNLRDTLETLKKHNYWCIGLDGHTDQIMHTTSLPDNIALILGAEGKGLRRLTRDSCDMLVKLPMSDQMESLNVSNAAAIALYELYRNTI